MDTSKNTTLRCRSLTSTSDDDNFTPAAEAVTAALGIRDEINDENKNGHLQEPNTAVSILADPAKIARPSFVYVHSLVYHFARHKKECSRWTQPLFGNVLDHGHHLLESRKERLTFLVRLLAILSCLCENHLDIYVSPSEILSGRDISGAHFLLTCLCSSTTFSSEKHDKAVQYLADEGDDKLYRRGVLTRRAFVRFQAIVRGRLARAALDASNESTSLACAESEETCSGSEEVDHQENMALKNKTEELKRLCDTLLDLKDTARKVRLA